LAEVNAQVLPSPLLPSSFCFCSIDDANAGILLARVEKEMEDGKKG
jgi:hypothetical protein